MTTTSKLPLGLEPDAYKVMSESMRDALKALRKSDEQSARTQGGIISGRINNAVRHPKFRALDPESKLDLIDGLMGDKYIAAWDLYFGDEWAKRIEKMRKASETPAQPALTLVSSNGQSTGSVKEPKTPVRKRSAKPTAKKAKVATA